MFEMITSGEWMLHLWEIGIVAAIIVSGVVSGFFRAHRVQPNGFRWKQFGFEFVVAIVGGYITGLLLGGTNRYLGANGFILFDQGAASWWRVAIEYVLYFVLLDTWFYWWHRASKDRVFLASCTINPPRPPLTTLSVPA